ncbi:efflux RND transporter permease subunit [Planctomicrobium piriforme]|uniref:Multidrug efflux pump subunit AcrB n=1 Tax=Planctomicrobium piriforme TaxID=1576369 RepID=A0A1I3PZ98_9PLAN|nr:efflux RND transporter permease subunit [Planctomicrobium piriforme]SFJ26531.1 Multidrug efflux pump subunit AcrB [Planctomicrobium piriforme]
MNPGEYSIRNNRVIFVSMLFVLLGGIVAYQQLGRLEDPEFTIKEALIITPYPGASAEEVAQEVTNPIEVACQQLGQLQRVESESTRGRSVVTAVIQDRYDKDSIPQVWDELRRKINDVQGQLPPSARGRTIVVDDFGDVYGVFLAISGDGYTLPELRRYAEFLRRELLLVQNVAKVDLFSEQQEVVFLQISRHRLASLGINEQQIYDLLQAKNIAADGGRVRVGDEHIVLDPQGGFDSAEDMLDIVIGSDRSGRQLQLRDVATIERRTEDPPRRLLKYDGQPAIGLGISTIQGGNVVVMGEGIRKKLDALKVNQPIGIEIGEINFQPDAVTIATNDFIFNLAKAVGIVFIVLLFAMGRKTGMIIGAVLFLTIMATFLVMYLVGGILMERISLGALIIALCMLTDNAIIVIEGIKVRIEAGEDKLRVVREVVAQNQWPLFGATAIGVIAFAAIGLSEDATGEYCNSLYWVILISLSLSWVSSITVTPLLSYLSFSPPKSGTAGQEPPKNPYDNFFFRGYRNLLEWSIQFRWLVLALAGVMFVAAVYGFTFVDQSFFPPATRPQFMVDCFLPSGTHLEQSEEFADVVGEFIQSQSGVTHLSSFIGGGGLRFLLVYTPERENRAFVQFLVDVDDQHKISGLIQKIQSYLDENYPDANTIAKKFLLGPGSGGRVQVRFRGPDPATLRQLAGKAMEVLESDGNTLCVRNDWRDRENVIRPELFESQARRNGITRVEVSDALRLGFEGRPVGFFREPGSAGGGTFPQESRLLPIIARPPADERNDVAALSSMQIFSPIAGRMIPLSQVVSDVGVAWEDPVVMRRDRSPTITVHADPRTGLPSQLFSRVRDRIEQIELPPGYFMEWGGEYENSRDARAALLKPLPISLVLMVFIVVCLFNSVRLTLLVWMIVPLAVIGVTAGLLITGQPFGFMALLGVLSLGGEQIKNSIVVLSKIRTNLADGVPHYQAILDGATSKLRPVLMVAITTVLGMIPLTKDPFFAAMAACIMFGLSFACVLTMIVMPVLYTILFRVEKPVAGTPQD